MYEEEEETKMAKGIVVEEEWKENFRLSWVISAMSFVYLSNLGGLVTQSNIVFFSA